MICNIYQLLAVSETPDEVIRRLDELPGVNASSHVVYRDVGIYSVEISYKYQDDNVPKELQNEVGIVSYIEYKFSTIYKADNQASFTRAVCEAAEKLNQVYEG